MYRDIDKKPALRDNPQLGYETSAAIGLMGPLLVHFLAIFRCKAPYFGFVVNCA